MHGAFSIAITGEQESHKMPIDDGAMMTMMRFHPPLSPPPPPLGLSVLAGFVGDLSVSIRPWRASSMLLPVLHDGSGNKLQD